MYQKIFKKILELSRAGYEVSIHADDLGYVLSIRNRIGISCSHIISYDEVNYIGIQAYLPFITELNSLMDKMGIDDIERLDPDLNWADFETFS